MKKLSLLVLLLVCVVTLYAQVRVSGYTRSNGTYVQPHYRSSPDKSPYNNYSYPGNTNPYTGKVATGDPDTYLKKYNGQSSAGSSTNYSIPSTSNSSPDYSGATYSSGSSVSSGSYAPASLMDAPLSSQSTLMSGQSSLDLTWLTNSAALKVEPSSPVHATTDVNSPIIARTSAWVQYEGEAEDDFIRIFIKNQYAYLGKRWVDLDDVKRRLKAARYAELVGKQIAVFQYSPLYEAPLSDAKIVANADERKVLVLENVSEDFLLVKYHATKGYMPKKYIDDF